MQKTAFNELYEILKRTGLDDDTINGLLFRYLMQELIGLYIK